MTEKEKLIALLQLSQDDVLSKFDASNAGYSSEVAADKLELYGPNEIKPQKKPNPVIGFVNVLINPFNLVLMVVILITFVSDILLTQD